MFDEQNVEYLVKMNRLSRTEAALLRSSEEFMEKWRMKQTCECHKRSRALLGFLFIQF